MYDGSGMFHTHNGSLYLTGLKSIDYSSLKIQLYTDIRYHIAWLKNIDKAYERKPIPNQSCL